MFLLKVKHMFMPLFPMAYRVCLPSEHLENVGLGLSLSFTKGRSDKLYLLYQICIQYRVFKWCCILVKIFWNQLKKKSIKGKTNPMEDFINCCCYYRIVPANED